MNLGSFELGVKECECMRAPEQGNTCIRVFVIYRLDKNPPGHFVCSRV